MGSQLDSTSGTRLIELGITQGVANKKKMLEVDDILLTNTKPKLSVPHAERGDPGTYGLIALAFEDHPITN